MACSGWLWLVEVCSKEWFGLQWYCEVMTADARIGAFRQGKESTVVRFGVRLGVLRSGKAEKGW